jgi:hypothetical protein
MGRTQTLVPASPTRSMLYVIYPGRLRISVGERIVGTPQWTPSLLQVLIVSKKCR